MTSHESFYRIVKKSGGILDTTAHPPPFYELSEMSFSAINQIKDSINKNSNILWPLGDLKTAIVSNPTFNAFAHHDEGEEGIAVYCGLFYLLLDLSCMLWSHSSFLKRTHPIKTNEKDLSIFIEHIRPLRAELVWNGPMGVYPTNQERAFRAVNTAITAYLFVCFHEVGHLVRAHIPYLQQFSNQKLNTLQEHNNRLDIANSNAIQKLEIDADLYAARLLADCALTTWNLGSIFPIAFPVNRCKLQLYLNDIFIGFALAFFCMDIPSRDSNLQTNTTHPVPAMRLATSYLAMSRLLQHPFKVSLKEISESFLLAYQEINDFWTILELPARTFDNEIRHLFEQCGDTLKRLHPLNEELRVPMDLRLRRFGTSASHYDQFASFYKKDSKQKYE